jgi:hypothetical protein
VCTYGLVALVILVPFDFVTPVVVDQYKLYEVAPVTGLQESVIWVFPAAAITPLGAAGGTAGATGVALTCAESTDSPAVFCAVTT